MICLTLHPVRMDIPLTARVAGDTLFLDGVPYDFAPLPEGGALPAEATGSEWVVGDILRRDGALHIGLVLPHGPDAPEETRFPMAITMVADGPVPLPPHTSPEVAE